MYQGESLKDLYGLMFDAKRLLYPLILGRFFQLVSLSYCFTCAAIRVLHYFEHFVHLYINMGGFYVIYLFKYLPVQVHIEFIFEDFIIGLWKSEPIKKFSIFNNNFPYLPFFLLDSNLIH